MVRVRGERESDAEMRLDIEARTQQGVRTLVFPSEQLLAIWRQRLAALA